MEDESRSWDEAALLQAAREAMPNAYAPYSKFRVGAALITAEGEIFAGVNVENASFPVGTCAERMAIGAMMTAGVRKAVAVAVVTESDVPVMPCGMCAQALAEVNHQMVVIAEGKDGVRAELTLGEILPHAFFGERLSSE